MNLNPIILNEAEFTDYKWLTPNQALDLYTNKELPLFPPQVYLITLLKFLTSSYSELRSQYASKF